MPKQILIVEPSITYAAKLAKTAEDAGWAAISHATFAAARHDLDRHRFEALAGNIRLDGFNAIHLAYIAKECRSDVAVILYSALYDPVLVREARAAGALYEPMESLVLSLPHYLAGPLPSRDRRVALLADGRPTVDGGRRASDRLKLALVLGRRDDAATS